jgi:hypothetical protein
LIEASSRDDDPMAEASSSQDLSRDDDLLIEASSQDFPRQSKDASVLRNQRKRKRNNIILHDNELNQKNSNSNNTDTSSDDDNDDDSNDNDDDDEDDSDDNDDNDDNTSIFEDYFPPDYVFPDNFNNIQIDDDWIIVFILRFQTRFRLPDTAIDTLIKFVNRVLSELDNERLKISLLLCILQERNWD